MLELKDLRIEAGDFALEADLDLASGGRIAVIGPSGAGKSTLLDAIAGFRAPSRGQVIWNGRDITDAPPAERPVGVLFQDQNLFPHLDLDRNLALALRPSGGRPTKEERARISDALERVGLAGLGARKPGALSGGQQSRAALARLLLQDRPVWLLDEPFAALGPALKREMLALLDETAKAQGALVLLVTHDPKDARQMTETVLVADGRAEAPVETEALLADPPPSLAAYLGQE
ncbi:thiamine ABC transporter ATP-binding protein [Litorisediminicola beolgyonensis]|uniref:ATP-binding cassette domain-containing protein n=1 Tax=Litorisediminicola beolgyonensis TaxID=1173614 RepID=A0ABW3ZE41_9RHOB